MCFDEKIRLEWIDELKGFLMIIVIWSHSLAFNSKWGYFLQQDIWRCFIGYLDIYLKIKNSLLSAL